MAIRIPDFDLLRPGYAGATVTVYKAGTTDLADLFSDEAGTASIGNPQTLTTTTIAGVAAGKFAQSVYTDDSYYLDIDTGEQTGVSRIPITTLDGTDADDAEVQPTGRSRRRALKDHLAQQIWAEDLGAFTGSASGNNSILQAAIGVAAAVGGGEVLLPAGTITFTQLTLPAGVVLRGKGREVTTLQSVVGAIVVLANGDRCGMRDLTLDGLSQQVNSFGFVLTNRSLIVLDNVRIKRFERCLYATGNNQHNRFRELYCSDASLNAALFQSNAVASPPGTVRFLEWIGGEVSAGGAGGALSFDYIDSEQSFICLEGIKFDGNVGVAALVIDGTRFVSVRNCHFDNNVGDILSRNASGVTTGNYKQANLELDHCLFDGGTLTFQDDTTNVVARDCDFRGVTFTLTTPGNSIKLENCSEDANCTITGDGTKLVRGFENLEGFTRGVTTGNVATKAWSLKLDHGEMCAGIAKVTGKQRNGTDNAAYVFAFTAKRANPTLAYDAQTSNFTVGLLVTGGTSGAQGRIVADADGGVTGTLTLHSVTGTFVDNEIITDTAGGSATANGALVAGSVSVLSQASITQAETDAAWACAAAATVAEIEVHVTGAAAKTIDWTVHVEAMRFG